MAIEGVDYSWDRPDPAALYRAGKRFAVRYVGPGSAGKLLTRSETRRLEANRLKVVLNAEGEVRAPLRGYYEGQRHARLARDNAHACGIMGDPVVYFSVDWDASNSDLAKVDEYLRGAATILGRTSTGVYGGYRTIDRYARSGLATWYWQTYAWSYGRVHRSAHLLQYHNNVSFGGAKVDLCRALKSSYGAARGGTSGAPPAPSDPLPPQGAPSWDYVQPVDTSIVDVSAYSRTTDQHARALDALRTL